MEQYCQACDGNDFAELPYYYIWKNKVFNLVKCRSCGLICQMPKPTDEEIEELYSEDYFDHGHHGLEERQATYEQIKDAMPVEFLQKKIKQTILAENPAAKSLFEIGAALGHLLHAAREMGMEVSGLEISQYANQRAKEKFGLDLYSGDFEKLDMSKEYGKWDAIYGGDVFEHFLNPGIVVDKIYDMLRPGGVAVLVVPSTFNLFSTGVATLLLRLTGKKRRLVDNPYHIHEFTTATARRIMQLRFRQVKITNDIKSPFEMNIKDGSLAYRIKWLFHLINYPFTKLTGRNGDRVTIIAIKD